MSNTIMEKEAKESPRVIAHQILQNDKIIHNIANYLQKMRPKHVMMIGRGSSSHAGVFAKYLIEIELNIPTSAAALSISSVYNKTLQLTSSIAIIISQSGRSPDIIAQAKMAKSGGAYCIALVNDPNSPLKDIVDVVVPLYAGEEVSVAATKSCMATLSALIHLVSVWSNNTALRLSLNSLPVFLDETIKSPSQLTPADFSNITNMVVLSRGLGFGIAEEISLKLKEVCNIHAEAFSSAEFLHGPITLLSGGLTVLNCLVKDESEALHSEQIVEVVKRKGHVLLLEQKIEKIHPRLAPLLLLQRFYIDIAEVSLSLGFHPDTPKGLKKVTQTL